LVFGSAWATDLEVHVINVGQADAILIICPCGEHQLLIDAAGTNRQYKFSDAAFKEFMLNHQNNNDEIEVVIATHPHADHIGNMEWILDNYSVGFYVDNGKTSTSNTWEDLEEKVEELEADGRHQDTQNGNVPDIDLCPLNNVTATLIIPDNFNASGRPSPNDYSLVVRVDYGSSSFLFVGDAEHRLEALFVSDGDTHDLLDCDFLKAGHHGSATSSTREFIELVTPDIAVISCGIRGVGSNVRYKHPRLSSIETLLDFVKLRTALPVGIEAYDTENNAWKYVKIEKKLYFTSSEGTLSFKSDGTSIKKIH
jgi:competence protein ComEC